MNTTEIKKLLAKVEKCKAKMATERDRILVSYQINLKTSIVEIEYANRIVEDGEVIFSETHKGAYELINGDLPLHVREEFGISMASLAGKALLSFTQANAELRAKLERSQSSMGSLTANSVASE